MGIFRNSASVNLHRTFEKKLKKPTYIINLKPTQSLNNHFKDSTCQFFCQYFSKKIIYSSINALA